MPVELETRELIARGAQGSVLLVFDKSQGRFLALKLVEVAGGEAEARRLLDELRGFASGEPDPPVAVLDFGRAADAPAGIAAAFPPGSQTERVWISMPYIHGPNARELAEGDDAFGPSEAASLLAQVAVRLRALHPARAHLDLKPENVLVDRAGRVFLVDPHMGTLAGTAAYAAPEQRGKGAEAPGPAADLYALGKLGAALLARRLPAEGDDPDLFPQLPEPSPDLPAEQRSNLKALGQLLRRLFSSDPGKRGTDPVLRPSASARPPAEPASPSDEVAKRLLEIAAALGGPDVTAPLAASVARAKLPARFERLAAATERARGEPGSVRSERSRGPNPGQVRPSTSLGANGNGTRSKLAWTVGTLALLATAIPAAITWLALRPPAHVNPAPSTPALRLPKKVDPADWIRQLGGAEACDKGHGLLTLKVDQPVERIVLRLGEGPTLWSNDAPQPGDFVKFDIVPHDYFLDVYYPDSPHPDSQQLNVFPGAPIRLVTHEHRDSAPITGPRTLDEVLKPADGPRPLSMGPAWIDDASWDPAAGTLAIASRWSECKDPFTGLPYGPQGRGPSDPRFHLDSGNLLCAYPKPGATGGFKFHLVDSEDENAP
jgi:serine/threonine protein kinase